jgi:hypothetical protein
MSDTPQPPPVALLNDGDQDDARIHSIAGEFREFCDRIKHAVEHGHLHAKAFRQTLALFRNDEQAREAFLRNMNRYIAICQNQGLFGSQHVSDLREE